VTELLQPLDLACVTVSLPVQLRNPESRHHLRTVHTTAEGTTCGSM